MGGHWLACLVTEQKFIFVPSFARDGRAQVLIESVSFSRDLTDREYGIENLGPTEVASSKMLRLDTLAGHCARLQKTARYRLSGHCGQLGFVHQHALAA
jgi:hypothetical protein